MATRTFSLTLCLLAASSLAYGQTTPASCHADPLSALTTPCSAPSATSAGRTMTSPSKALKAVKATGVLSDVKDAADDLLTDYLVGPNVKEMYGAADRLRKSEEDAVDGLLDDWDHAIDGSPLANQDRVQHDGEVMQESAATMLKAGREVVRDGLQQAYSVPVRYGREQLELTQAGQTLNHALDGLHQAWNAAGAATAAGAAAAGADKPAASNGSASALPGWLQTYLKNIIDHQAAARARSQNIVSAPAPHVGVPARTAPQFSGSNSIAPRQAAPQSPQTCHIWGAGVQIPCDCRSCASQ
jgi:hypothetical protein